MQLGKGKIGRKEERGGEKEKVYPTRYILVIRVPSHACGQERERGKEGERKKEEKSPFRLA